MKTLKEYLELGKEIVSERQEDTPSKSHAFERPYMAVHAKKGKIEVFSTTSYGAAQRAATKWNLKSTAGIDVYLADVKHKPTM